MMSLPVIVNAYHRETIKLKLHLIRRMISLPLVVLGLFGFSALNAVALGGYEGKTERDSGDMSRHWFEFPQREWKKQRQYVL